MKSPIKRLGHSYIANSKKIQDGCQQKKFYDKITMSKLKNKFYFPTLYENNKVF